ncbi:MAG TPA: hypothetical protein VHP32_10905 [Ignavibacteria bacterium]|nr:hypothetical protein [Ignavibacteria bacterium]
MGLELNREENIITNYETLDDIDVDIRLRYSTTFRCTDGHYVRSKNEVIIDNWLYERGIVHIYEKKVIGENIICDFYLRSKDGNAIYIEVWGLDTDQYKKRKKEKIDFYLKNKLNLINITDVNIRNIDDFLEVELKKYKLI